MQLAMIKELGSLVKMLKGPGVRFCIVGGCLTMLDLLLFQLFANTLHISLFGVEPNITAVWLGTPIVITINFFISHKFVWNSKVPRHQTFIPFFGLNLFSGVIMQSIVIAIIMMILAMFVDSPGADPMLNLAAKCAAVGVGMIINFFGARYLFKWNE